MDIVNFLYLRSVWIVLAPMCFLLIRFGIICIYGVFLYPFFFSPLRYLPGPKDDHYIIGQAYKQFKAADPFKLYLAWSRQWPESPFIRYLSFGNSEILLANSLTAHQEIFQTKCYSFIKPAFFARLVGEITGRGIIFAEGDEHRKQRKLLNVIFSHANIKRLLPVVQVSARELADKLNAEIGNGVLAQIEILSILSKAALDVICEVTVGMKSTQSLHRCYDRIFNQSKLSMAITTINTWIPIRKILPIEANLGTLKAQDGLERILRQQIRDRTRCETDGSAKNGELTDTTDVLMYLIQNRAKSWTEDEIVGYLLNFITAGHETIATALMWAIHSLSTRPDLQRRLRCEVDDAINNRSIEYADMEQLRFLHDFCREVLRVYSPIIMTAREAALDVNIDGITIPKGTVVIVCPKLIQSDPAIWGPHHATFDPDRWRDLPGLASNPHAFQAFGGGPRICIGKGLAMMELKVMLIELVKKFEFEPTGKEIVMGNYLTNRPKGGLEIKIRRRA